MGVDNVIEPVIEYEPVCKGNCWPGMKIPYMSNRWDYNRQEIHAWCLRTGGTSSANTRSAKAVDQEILGSE